MSIKKTFKLKKLVVVTGPLNGGHVIMVVFRGKVLLWRQFNFSDLKYRALNLLRYLQLWPVYFETWSRDCDLCEGSNAYRFPTYWHAMRSLNSMAYGWTEGPFNYWQISRHDYKSFQPETRDRILEAYENGNGTRVIL